MVSDDELSVIRPPLRLALRLHVVGAVMFATGLAPYGDPTMGQVGQVVATLVCWLLAFLTVYILRRPKILVGADTITLAWYEIGAATFDRHRLASVRAQWATHRKVVDSFDFLDPDGTTLAQLPTGQPGWRHNGPWTIDQLKNFAEDLGVKFIDI
jgi:hypothetical protein